METPHLSAPLALRLVEARVRRVICSATPLDGSRPVQFADGFALDRHGHREMLYVMEGCSHFLYRDRVWKVAPGTLVVIDAWETHSFGYRTTDNGLRHIWLGLHPSCLTCTYLGVERGRHRSIARLESLSGASLGHLSRQWGEVAAGDLEPSLRTALLAGVAEAAMRAIAVETACSVEPLDNTRGLADFVAEYIMRQHGRDCSLARLERVTGYSRFYLSRLFRRQRGMTIGQAIVAARLRFLADAEAQGLKQCGIAEALGFSSPSAFCLWKRRNRPAGAGNG